MENLLQVIPGVCMYIDDIIVTVTTDEEHLHNLSEVLSRLEKAGMRLKKEKCDVSHFSRCAHQVNGCTHDLILHISSDN